MNNYISLNLVSGKLGRLVGGGRPTFILGEQNEVQLYILDYIKPTTYPAGSLSDAYASEIIPVNYNTSSVTLKAGVRGGSAILSTSSFSNLPTIIQFTTSGTASGISTQGDDRNIVEGNFSYSSIPTIGSKFRATFSLSSGTLISTAKTPTFTYDTSISDISYIFMIALDALVYEFISLIGNSSYFDRVFKLFQISDLSFSFYYTARYLVAFPVGTTFSISIENISASSNYGKYGQLDFSSPAWSSIIGTNNEKEIWMEARIGSDTISQGNAKICRKMT